MSSKKREASPEASPLKGPAPVAQPEDTSDVAFEDGIPLSPMTGDQTVQFISGAPINGDAKVEIGDSSPQAPPTFVGLGKEELMKYANDPFWVKLRWFLFILFWILWIAMLVGAVVIIVLAPRCAEKKATTETYYQVKARDLVKGGQPEQHAKKLQSLGVDTIIVSELLQHDPQEEPEAVTDFKKVDITVESGLFDIAIKELKDKGIKLLLKIVPNHSGTKHEWFNDPLSDMYVRKPYTEVQNASVWVTQDSKEAAWAKDPQESSKAYLHQFSGNVADLNFRSDEVIDNFKAVISHWKSFGFDGFMISKASYLVEDLEKLMSQNATRNQPENVNIIAKILGLAGKAANLVELDAPSNETMQQYIDKGMVPTIRTVDTANTNSIRQSLENLSGNPKAVVNIAELKSNSFTSDKARLVHLLAGAAGSHTMVNKDDEEDEAFLTQLLAFKKESPRGKEAKIKFSSSGEVIAILRSDGEKHLTVANFGMGEASFNPSALNLTDEVVDGVVTLATPNASQKKGESISGNFSLRPLSGVVIEMKKSGDEA